MPWSEIVKGYEYEQGQFVVMTEADFDRAAVEATQTIDIRDFVPAAEIDFSYFEATTGPRRTATRRRAS